MAYAKGDPSLVQRIGITGRKRAYAVTLLSLQSQLQLRLRDWLVMCYIMEKPSCCALDRANENQGFNITMYNNPSYEIITHACE